MYNLLATATPLFAATKTKSSGSSAFFLIIIVVIGALYFLFLRPQQQKARKQRENMSSVEVGDEVLTVGGIVGEVIHVDGDRLTLRCAPGTSGPSGTAPDFDPTHFVVLRSAIARKVDPPVADDGAEDSVNGGKALGPGDLDEQGRTWEERAGLADVSVEDLKDGDDPAPSESNGSASASDVEDTGAEDAEDGGAEEEDAEDGGAVEGSEEEQEG